MSTYHTGLIKEQIKTRFFIKYSNQNVTFHVKSHINQACVLSLINTKITTSGESQNESTYEVINFPNWNSKI